MIYVFICKAFKKNCALFAYIFINMHYLLIENKAKYIIFLLYLLFFISLN